MSELQTTREVVDAVEAEGGQIKIGKCQYADRYKAARRPSCGCFVCWDKWIHRNPKAQ